MGDRRARLPHERIDVGGAFGKTKEPFYLAMNPNSLVPTLEEDGFMLWESNSIVRYLAAKHGAGTLEPADLQRARARQQMDGLAASVTAPAITPVFWGLIRTPPEKRDPAEIDAGKDKSMAAMKMLDAQLGKTAFVAGDEFSMGDIPVALMTYRYRRLVPERPRPRQSRPLVRRDRAAAGIQGARAGDPIRVVEPTLRSPACEAELRAMPRYSVSPLSSLGTSPTRPAASRMKKLLQRGQAVDQAEADIAHQAQRVRPVGEQPVETVGRNSHRHGVEPPPALIAVEHGERAGIEAEPHGIDDHFGQRRHVLEPHIEPLPRDRMDHVRGVADQRDAFGDESARDRKAERKGAARANRRDLAEMQSRSGARARHGSRHRGAQRYAPPPASLGPHDRGTAASRASLFSGRIANGPAGRKCSSARPP